MGGTRADFFVSPISARKGQEKCLLGHQLFAQLFAQLFGESCRKIGEREREREQGLEERRGEQQ